MTFQEKTCIILNRVKESKLCIYISLLATFIFLNLPWHHDCMTLANCIDLSTYAYNECARRKSYKGWINGNISVHNELILSWDNYKSGDRMTDGQTDREREGRFEHTCQPGPPGESCCSSHMACHH